MSVSSALLIALLAAGCSEAADDGKDAQLSRCVVVAVGREHSSHPYLSDEKLAEEFGPEGGPSCKLAADALMTTYFESGAESPTEEVDSMIERASKRFRVLHPEISDEAVEALEWSYSYSYR